MIFPANYEEKCGFIEIRQMLIERCLSPFGIEKVNQMTFQCEYQVVNFQLDQVQEFVQLIQEERGFPLDHYIDTRSIVNQVMKDEGLWCTIEDFTAIKHTLLHAERIYHIVTQQKAEQYSYPTVALVGQGVVLLTDLLARIDQVLDKNGQVRNSASKVLAAIRKEKIQVAHAIQKKFDTIWRKAQATGLTDNEMAASVRDGRMVIPVTASLKRRFKGVIHDESRSGKTVFIEPEELVKENTRLFVLEQDERREVVRILMEMTTSIRQHYAALNKLYDFIGEVDILRAKALLGQKIGGVKPIVEPKQQIVWTKAYHPILQNSLKEQGKELNPLTIALEEDHRILVVSGANSGGKSVTLKTVALLQYMLQCGLLIPVASDSRAGIFEHILMDIGDGQSIENNLSTYTAHLNNMNLFLTHTQAQTLILIDEFGGGTEPELGGAIAESILEQLNQRGCFGIITTHFYNLKGLAQRTKGLQNGAMLYDFNEMKPLYQLSQGHPGSSYALDVARRIGLSEEILINASQKIDTDYLIIEQQLQEVVAQKVANLKADKTIIETIALIESKESLDDTLHIEKQEELEISLSGEEKSEIKPPVFKVGDEVRLEAKGKRGKILEIRGKKALLLLEGIKFTVSLDQLQ